MKKFLQNLLTMPLILLAADLWISAVKLLIQFYNQPPAQISLSEKIPLESDDIQLMQVAGNFSLTLIITLGIISLVWLHHKVGNKQQIKMNGLKITGLLIMVAYSLPSLWTLAAAFIHLFTHGSFPLSLNDKWSVIIALILPYSGILLAIRLIGYFKTRKTNQHIPHNYQENNA